MRWFFRFLLGFVVILAIAWLGLWWYAEGRMQSVFEAWAEQIAARGGQVSYDSLQRGGSPARAAILLNNVRVTLPAAPGVAAPQLILPTLGLRIDALNPLLLHVDLPARVRFSFNNVDAVVTSGSVTQTDRLDPKVLTGDPADPVQGGDFAATDVDVLASGGSLLVLHIDDMRGHWADDAKAGPDGVAFASDLTLDGVGLAPLLTRLLSIPFDGKVAHLAYTARASGPVPAGLAALPGQLNALPAGDEVDRQKLVVPLLRQWAVAGGSGNISLAATVGPLVAQAAGRVKFDANAQPVGTADLTADHLDAFTGALTSAYPALQGTVAGLEAQVSPYITADAAGQSLAIHASFGNGAVVVNGKQTATMPPVDWQALENPPPAPVAPGDGSGAAGP